ncbi:MULTISPECIES: ATP phosphoribosyltransferase regulatory subunit [Acidithiobacillus]|jgi:ATP phosphoribosyltransferase regulatory subunit|uniref:ATP phosphoribosyltransferase regulatory subunit n=4 Tax=Acidithiobacillus caldus TaxID=33059 RepID=F9ZP76_ACICS|nr:MULTISPECIES: ATP phosphoribosyltransferase regulatory subunit [Acidithiobacillus]AEK58434.1 ATP phosphoribosyltransferase regulatory subunit [Acidithiobacillus caldus SM-1]AIA55402.1 ATP phosphoribosyltransferase regulatory subunit [Acidithiobacillus caldus ATCC 51756]AUW33024.1 ATP phosphoribosyltransferase regulatory subunit [Acidithiobacillus caldus]MBU2729527.1 ATP phosphoribosyltransferase regulatory subunit [Acidithiobacillus caldus]MBU2734874.1 ATP phosphoribosyltransferase regulato
MKIGGHSPAWLLPAGFEDLGPARAEALEKHRRALLDLFARWGYRLVIPPMLEHLESLLTGSAADLDLQTWKVLDQASSRLLGFRSDMTPQMARMDAQMSRDHDQRRLCYAGTVLRALPDALGGSRAPYQVGAECFGVAGPEGDLEILSLLIESVALCQDTEGCVLDLGHVAVARSLVAALGLEQTLEARVLAAVERKAWPDLHALLEGVPERASARADFTVLAGLHGGREVLERARSLLGHRPVVRRALEELDFVWEALHGRYPHLAIQCDLAELHGHRYHTGMLFAVYGPQRGEPLAQGGRYDGIGRSFGCERPATGFSLDLKPLLRDSLEPARGPRIWAPASVDTALWRSISDLRAQGYIVVQGGPGPEAGAAEEGYDGWLEARDGSWILVGDAPEFRFPAG